MALFPKRYSVETRLPPKRLMRKLEGELVEYRPTVNILSAGRFMKTHRQESIYYGRHNADSFELYYHRAKRRDGSSTGFYGKVVKSEKGSLVTGVFRKPVYAYIVSAVWFALCLLSAGAAYGGGESKVAYMFLALGAAGLILMLFDSNEMYLRAYLDALPKPKETEPEEADMNEKA
ncbi:MAG: hypothetical protein IJ737_03050 [Ruminococcus sp.]|nr:hypothetical protein [Ruminococcus sp.]